MSPPLSCLSTQGGLGSHSQDLHGGVGTLAQVLGDLAKDRPCRDLWALLVGEGRTGKEAGQESSAVPQSQLGHRAK